MTSTAIVLGRTGIGKSEYIRAMKEKYDKVELKGIVYNGTDSFTKGYQTFLINSLSLNLIDTAGFLDSAGEGKEYEALLRLFKDLQGNQTLKALIYLVDRLSDFDFILIEKFQQVIVKPNIIVVQNKVTLQRGQTLDTYTAEESKKVARRLSSVGFVALPTFLPDVEESIRCYMSPLDRIVEFVRARQNFTVDVNACDLFFRGDAKMGDPFKENKTVMVQEQVPYQHSEPRTKSEQYSETIQEPFTYKRKTGFFRLGRSTATETRPVLVNRTREVPYTFTETRYQTKSFRCTYEVTKQEKYRIRIDQLKVPLGYVVVEEKLVSKVEANLSKI